ARDRGQAEAQQERTPPRDAEPGEGVPADRVVDPAVEGNLEALEQVGVLGQEPEPHDVRPEDPFGRPAEGDRPGRQTGHAPAGGKLQMLMRLPQAPGPSPGREGAESRAQRRGGDRAVERAEGERPEARPALRPAEAPGEGPRAPQTQGLDRIEGGPEVPQAELSHDRAPSPLPLLERDQDR